MSGVALPWRKRRPRLSSGAPRAFEPNSKRGFFRPLLGFAGAIGCDGGDGQGERQDVFGVDGRKLAGRRARRHRMEPSLYVSISSQKLGGAFRFVAIGGHGFVPFGCAQAMFSSSVELPAFTDRPDREAPPAEGRAERAGACDGPL